MGIMKPADRLGDSNRPTRKTRGRSAVVVALSVLALSFAVAQTPDNTPIRPTIPTANRYQRDKVFLERADELTMREGTDFQLVVGNVEFRKGDMFMYCDSAHFYDTDNSLDAFGNVRMEQGDTLFVYADELSYNGDKELAELFASPGKKVRLINRDVMLETDVFNYDMAINLGYYNVGGVLTDKQNRLESIEGEYSPDSKDANFYGQVHLNSHSQKDTLDIYTDTLLYNTGTHVAELVCYSEIINAQGTIFTTNGTYNTSEGLADLYDRSLVVTKTDKTLTGDTLFYDRKRGYGEAFGNMVLTDSVKKTTLKGDYGFYNELTDSAFVTGHALGMEYSGQDTLYMHGDTIRAFRVINEIPADSIREACADTTHYVIVNPRVRFYRADIQGLCDSLTLVQRDSMMYLDIHPIVWSGERQIFGSTIEVHFNDSTADWANLPRFGLMAEAIEDGFYNQLSGKVMKAYFENQDLKYLDVSGNVQAIFLPQESDSTYNKIFNVESSFLAADFNKRQLEKMKLWPQTNGTGTPLYLAKKSLYYLPQFKWYGDLRPVSPEDVFNYPDGMAELFAVPDLTERHRSVAPAPVAVPK